MSYYKRISKAFKDVPVIPLAEHTPIVLVSDCHRGNGSQTDNFLKNQNIYFAALQHYYEAGYTYIEIGDGDELWENRSMDQIEEIHSNVFWLRDKFAKENRLGLIYGNHDMARKREGNYHSGLILKDEILGKDIYLTHGHQADFLNSVLWRLARFLVRYIWRPLEAFAFKDPTNAAKNNTQKRKIEKRLTEWAKGEGHILICGHTHRPMLGTPDSPYFNTGSCVHPRCITCLEIVDRCITLVKWTVDIREDRSLYITRMVLADKICIDEY